MLNIQKHQIQKKTDEIVDKELKNGNIITNYSISTKLNEFFKNNVAGLPYFKNTHIIRNSKSNKEEYNSMFKKLEDDITIANYVFQEKEFETLNAKNNFDLEILELYKQYDKLCSEMLLLKEHSDKNIIYDSYVINFNDLSDVNKRSLNLYNVPKTNCEIDYETSSLRTFMHSAPSDKIDISKSKINITSTLKTTKILGDVENIFTENSIEATTVEASCTTLLGPRIIYVDLELDTIYYASSIDLISFNTSNSSIKLLTSVDGKNYIEKDTINGKQKIKWMFNKEQLKYIKFVITKKEADYYDDIESFNTISLLNISIYNDKYEKNGIYTSNKIEFSNPITDITLRATHSMPPKTDISYFIGYENSNNSVEWKPIKNNETIDLKLLSKREEILNYVTSEDFGSWDIDTLTNNKLFYIYNLPNKTNKNSIELRAGHSQWLLESVDASNKIDDKTINTDDFVSQNISAFAPLDMTMTELRCEKEWNYFSMSAYLISESEQIISNRYIYYDLTTDSQGKEIEYFDTLVLINGKKIFPTNGKYSFKLNKGENYIKIIILFGNQDISNPEKLKTIKHNFNLLAYCSNVFAGPVMNKVSYNLLNKNINNKELKYYAIKTKDNLDYIVTKFDPNYILSPFDPKTAKALEDSPVFYQPTNVYINNSEYMRMYIKYNYMPNSIVTNIDNKSEELIRLRVMARLMTEDISVSPTINRIEVLGF